MITQRQIEIANVLLGTGLVNSVYHSVELLEDEKGIKYPGYKMGAEQFYVGPDDEKKMYAYIRQNGPTLKVDERLEGSCSKMYKMSSPQRVVIFQDHVKDNFDGMIKRFLAVGFLKDVTLVSFNNNLPQLLRQEAKVGDFKYDSTTFYLAIDLQVKFWISGHLCNDEDLCTVHPNPICS